MKKTNVYLVNLGGIGDRKIFLVRKDVWDWINDGGQIPQSLIDLCREQQVGDEEFDWPKDDNDRALFAGVVHEHFATIREKRKPWRES